ncbi:MAG: hypothetical protein IPG45_17465 [Deltaproteobacteria bacterium]|nr:hypothetical protein [Deltaproteobacteria bacterium]
MSTIGNAVNVDGILNMVQRTNAAGEKARFVGAQKVQDVASERAKAAREERDQLEGELTDKQEARAEHAAPKPGFLDRLFGTGEAKGRNQNLGEWLVDLPPKPGEAEYDQILGTKTYQTKDEGLAADVARTETDIEEVDLELETTRAISKEALQSMKDAFDDRKALEDGLQDVLQDLDQTQDQVHRGLRG